MKILLLDVETSPNTAYVWSLFKEYIPLARLIESSEVICYSARWYGDPKIQFDSIHSSSSGKMLRGIHALLDQADVVVHYNGMSFDIPCLNRDFLKHGLTPPSPYRQIDLLQVVRKQFRFTSNKMDHVCEQLGLGNKSETTFKLWVDCMNHVPSAWRVMKEYNMHDVDLLTKLYDVLKPWIRSHPNHALYGDKKDVCPSCGGKHYTKRGFLTTFASIYQRFQCKDCGTWFRSAKPAKKSNLVYRSIPQ